MNFISLSGPRLIRITSFVARKLTPHSFVVTRKLCSANNSTSSGSNSEGDSDNEYFEEPVKRMWKSSYFDLSSDERSDSGETRIPTRQRFLESTRTDADRVLETLRQDGPGFDTQSALDELGLRLSGLLVRKVLFGVLKNINHSNKIRCAKIGFKFFIWSGLHGSSNNNNYKHTSDSYHLLMKIFAECEEFKAMWRLVDEMIEKGLQTSARTLNILICTCGEIGLAKEVIERFIKSKTFKFRPFKHSYNAILISLHVLNQHSLIEWVYGKMLEEGQSPDTLTYNVVMLTKYRLGKVDEFHRMLDEMDRAGFSPDLHTYNILLLVLGRGNKPLAALNLLSHMREMGVDPSILHFTTLIDGLSRAGNLEASEFFFGEIAKNGFYPDVVCFTVMITGYVIAGRLEEAQGMFDRMVKEGQVPNVYTYNAMIRGLCMGGRFDEACSVLRDMESRGCRPNFVVYSTLVTNLRNAGKFPMAHQIVKHMVENGRYVHLIGKILRYKRS